MPRRQGEQLHELRRAPLLPCLSGDATSIDRDLEPTEHADLDARHTQRILPTQLADKDASTTPTHAARAPDDRRDDRHERAVGPRTASPAEARARWYARCVAGRVRPALPRAA